MKKIERTIMNAELDEAKARARINAQEGVNMVVEMLNAASDDSAKTKFIMDGATARGFDCEFWPVNGGMAVRVRWENK
jgi:hypothetical protein